MADELRPRRLWYWVAAAIAVLGLAGAVASAVVLGRSAADLVNTVDELDPQLRPLLNGRTTTVELGGAQTQAQDWAVYVASTEPTPVSCGGAGLTVTDVPREITVTRDGTTWREVQLVRPSEPGRHEITCSAADRTADLAIGRALDADDVQRTGGQVVRLVIAAVAVLAFGGTGVLVGGLIALVVAVRRSRYRAAQRPPYPVPGAP